MDILGVVAPGSKRNTRQLVTRAARAEGNSFTSTDVSLRLVSMRTEPRSWPAGLSRSEREVAKLLIRGYSYAEIASYRGVSRETVSAQIRGMLRKLGVDSASRLVAFLACYGEDSTL